MNEAKTLTPKTRPSGQAGLLSEIINSMPQALILLDSNRCVVDIFNVPKSMMDEYGIEDMLGKPIIDIYNKRKDAPYFAICRQISDAIGRVQENGTAINVEYKLLGTPRKATLSKLSDGKILIQIHDISKFTNKKNESKRNRRNELNMILKAERLVPWRYDIENKTIQFLQQNDIFASDATLNELQQYVHPNYRRRVSKMFEEIGSGLIDHDEVTIQILDASGEFRWIKIHAMPYLYDDKGNVSVIIGSKKDITKKRKYEQQQTELMRQNKLIMDNANAGFIFITPDYRVAWQNTSRVLPPEFEDGTFFFETGELCYKNEHRLKNSHTRELVESAFADKTVHRVEKQLPHSIWIDMTTTPVTDANDVVEGVVLKIEDISSRKKAEEEIERRKQRLREVVRQNEMIMNNSSSGFVYITSDRKIVWENVSKTFDDPKMSSHFLINHYCHKFSNRGELCIGCPLCEAFALLTPQTSEVTTDNGLTFEIVATPIFNPKEEIEGVVLRINDISETKAVNQKLKEAIRQSELIMNNSNAGFVYLTPDYKVVWENVSTIFPKFSQYSVYPVGNHCYKTFGRTEPCENCVMQQALESNSLCRYEHTMCDGHTAEIFANPVFNNKKDIKGIILHISDITEQKKYIRKIEESEQEIATKNQLLAGILEHLPYPLFIKDASNNYNYLLANKAYNKLWSIPEGWIIGKNDYDMFPAEEADMFRAADMKVVNKQELYIVEEETHAHNDKKRIWRTTKAPLINKKSGQKMLIGVALDITELIQERHEVEYANRLLDFTFIAGGSIPWEWDVESGKMFSANKFSLFYKNNILVSEYIAKFVHPDHRKSFSQLADDLREKRSDTIDTKLQILYNDKYEWTHIVGKTFIDQRTKRAKVLGVSWFITKEVEQQQELIEAKRQAERSDALKSAFLANMSHEIRTPLNAIVGFSELLQEVTDDEERKTYLSIINSNNELLLKLIGDVLDLSKIEAGYINYANSRFDLEELLGELEVVFQNRVKSEVQVVHRKSYDHCLVELDRSRITQIITNFLTNAIKFTTQGSIEMRYEIIESGIQIYVQDTGCGISEENVDKVFDRFVKLDNFTQGTGLGMAICKAIAESSGGRIGVESELGRGTTFRVWLPTSTETKEKTETYQPRHISPATHRQARLDKSSVKVLVAEDKESNYLLIKAILKDYDLTHVDNGADAVEILGEHDFDIVLMDIQMPVMDGLEATRKIREFNNNIPIVAVTANAFEENRVQASKAGCTSFLIKPIEKQKLIKVIEDFMAQ